MIIETYSEKYYSDVVRLIENFHDEAIQYYDEGLDKDVLTNTILAIGQDNSNNAFLLIVDNRCEGILAGIESPALLNKKRIYQELIWYINKPFRKYGVNLLKAVEARLQAQGYNTIIMGVLENSKTKTIKKLYERMGFKLFESQYIKGL